MTSSWKDRLTSAFGTRVVDVMAGTALQPHAESLDFGLFVVHDAVEQGLLVEWEEQMGKMIKEIQTDLGKNSVLVKSKAPGGRPLGGPLL